MTHFHTVEVDVLDVLDNMSDDELNEYIHNRGSASVQAPETEGLTRYAGFLRQYGVTFDGTAYEELVHYMRAKGMI